MNYYGYDLDKCLDMEYNTYLKLSRCMYINESRDRLNDLTINCYSSLKKEARDKVHKRFYKQSYPNEFIKKKNIVKLTDIKRALNV
jgi:hypothetical protein